MIRTLLFDLDDTLLDNDMSTFVPAYLRLWSEHISPRVDGDHLVREMLAGTRAMVENTDPARTLRSVFASRFYPALGLRESELRDDVAVFYAERFPALRATVGRRASARAVIAWAFDAGFEVVIATNPLFPRVALEQRLQWAGVGVDEFPYALITTDERMHFAKSHPEYYAEILALVGRRPEEALMIGNEWANDILPASAVGIPVFWIASPADRPPRRGAVTLAGQGDLDDFIRWARDEDCLPQVAAAPQTTTALLARTRAVPAAVLDAVRCLSDQQWGVRPAEDEWSLVEIVCHLRDSELEVLLPRIERVLSEDEPFLSAVDADQWAEQRSYGLEHGPTALREYVRARMDNYGRLAALPETAWERRARHALLGPTDLAELVSIALEHDRLHLAQLRDTRRALYGPVRDH